MPSEFQSLEEMRFELRRANEEIAGLKNALAQATRRDEEDKNLSLIRSLIKFRDQLLLFRENAPDELTIKLLSGLYQETGRIMAQNGIELLNGDGPFSPDRHTAVDTRPSNDPERIGTIADTFRDGYAIAGEILRPQEVVLYVEEKF